MQLTLDQTATRLGKTARQIRYLIQSERLAAKKVGGRWVIESKDLPLSDGQRKTLDRKERQLRHAVEEGLGLAESEQRPPRFSVCDLKAFQIALPLYREILASLGAEHAAGVALRETLDCLSRGCHRYELRDKAEAYRSARDAASLAACELVLSDNEASEAMLQTLEQDLMAALAGLIRRTERKRSR